MKTIARIAQVSGRALVLEQAEHARRIAAGDLIVASPTNEGEHLRRGEMHVHDVNYQTGVVTLTDQAWSQCAAVCAMDWIYRVERE